METNTKQKQAELKRKIATCLEDMVRKDKDLQHCICLIHSDRSDIHWEYARGVTGSDQKPIQPDQPYHIASIGKTFTSVLIAKLSEQSLINYNEPIADILPPEILDGLFRYKDTDYTKDVLVRHLLNHTSGIADYYEDKPVSGRPVKKLIVEEPQQFWTPDQTIEYTKTYQRAVAPPGRKFHYSDTGYNLLGKIIEQITGLSFHENMHRAIFKPLGMKNTYLPFYSKPEENFGRKMADVFIGRHNVSTYNSLSIDWAGGGIVSTANDLLKFHKSLAGQRIITPAAFSRCCSDRSKFGFGMDYGYGILFINIGKMTWVLPEKLNIWGNLGSIGAYMFYNPAFDIYLIGSFNHSKYRVRQVFFLIGLLRKLAKAF